MIPASRCSRAVCAFMLMLLALPLAAETRRHSANPVVSESVLTGFVRDVSNNAPVKNALIISSDGPRAATDETGRYILKLKSRPVNITVQRAGYVTATKTVSASSPLSLDFAVAQTSSAIVKTTSGETVFLDLDSAKFAYLVPFGGYIATDFATLCKSGGEPFKPTKSEIARIVGPTKPADVPACCTKGPVQGVTVELKNGESSTGYFNDSCFGYNIDFYGIERTSGVARYFSFSNIDQITFP